MNELATAGPAVAAAVVLAGDMPGVFVQFKSIGEIQLIVDSASRQNRFNLWARKQLMRNEEDL